VVQDDANSRPEFFDATPSDESGSHAWYATATTHATTATTKC